MNGDLNTIIPALSDAALLALLESPPAIFVPEARALAEAAVETRGGKARLQERLIGGETVPCAACQAGRPVSARFCPACGEAAPAVLTSPTSSSNPDVDSTVAAASGIESSASGAAITKDPQPAAGSSLPTDAAAELEPEPAKESSNEPTPEITVEPTAGATPPAAAEAAGTQADIESLLASVAVADVAASVPTSTGESQPSAEAGLPKDAVVMEPAANVSADAAAETAAASVSPSEIEALLASAAAEVASTESGRETKAETVTEPVAKPETAGSQSDIESLLASVSAEASPAANPPAPATPAAAETAASQSDIESLLASAAAQSPGTASAPEAAASQSDIESLLAAAAAEAPAGPPTAPAPAPSPPPASPSAASAASQSDVELLMAAALLEAQETKGESGSAAVAPAAPSPSAPPAALAADDDVGVIKPTDPDPWAEPPKASAVLKPASAANPADSSKPSPSSSEPTEAAKPEHAAPTNAPAKPGAAPAKSRKHAKAGPVESGRGGRPRWIRVHGMVAAVAVASGILAGVLLVTWKDGSWSASLFGLRPVPGPGLGVGQEPVVVHARPRAIDPLLSALDRCASDYQSVVGAARQEVTDELGTLGREGKPSLGVRIVQLRRKHGAGVASIRRAFRRVEAEYEALGGLMGGALGADATLAMDFAKLGQIISRNEQFFTGPAPEVGFDQWYNDLTRLEAIHARMAKALSRLEVARSTAADPHP